MAFGTSARKEEGVKDRPCAIVMVVTGNDSKETVTVLPVTHTPPGNADMAVEIPSETKDRLGLDSKPSWVVISEANRFTWPGPDLRVADNRDAASVAYGPLPRAFYLKIRDRFNAAIAKNLAQVALRTD